MLLWRNGGDKLLTNGVLYGTSPKQNSERSSKGMQTTTGCLWLTGRSGAGKTTLAEALRDIALAEGRPVEVLDGDAMRAQLSPKLGFSKADRDLHVQRVGQISSRLAIQGVLVIASLISPFEEAREKVRTLHAANGVHFGLVYLNATTEQCAERDPKGLYAKARQQGTADFTGLTQPYEPPQKPDLVLETGTHPLKDCLAELEAFARASRFL
ncbi:adenylylsulfate kinase (plasmid) [Arthrobacter sp. ZXY-2]|nr:adenylylsulfate kinase [Arthrobacter sp. ZXY-2]